MTDSIIGKVVLTGAKVRQDINTAFENIFPTLQGDYRPTVYPLSSANAQQISKLAPKKIRQKI